MAEIEAAKRGMVVFVEAILEPRLFKHLAGRGYEYHKPSDGQSMYLKTGRK
jgi:hypothetical protein